MDFWRKRFSAENGMKLEDWFDVLMHGTPWVLLLISIVLNLFSLQVKNDQQ